MTSPRRVYLSAPQHANAPVSTPIGMLPPWTIIEIQGSIDTQYDEDFSASKVKDIELGDLTFDEKGTPILIIGKHKLVGKRVPLKKPLAVVRKPPKIIPAAVPVTATREYDLGAMELDAEATLPDDIGTGVGGMVGASMDHNRKEMTLDVVCLIRHKFLFTDRPMPIISEENKGLTSFKKTVAKRF